MLQLHLEHSSLICKFDHTNIDGVLLYALLVINTVDYLANQDNKIFYYFKYMKDIYYELDDEVIKKYVKLESYTINDIENILQDKILSQIYITTNDYLNALKITFPKDISYTCNNELHWNTLTDIIPAYNKLYYPYLPTLLKTVRQYNKKRDEYLKKKNVILYLMDRKIRKFYVDILGVNIDNFKNAVYNTTVFESITSNNIDNIKELKERYNIHNRYNVTFLSCPTYNRTNDSHIAIYLILMFFTKNDLFVFNRSHDKYFYRCSSTLFINNNSQDFILYNKKIQLYDPKIIIKKYSIILNFYLLII